MIAPADATPVTAQPTEIVELRSSDLDSILPIAKRFFEEAKLPGSFDIDTFHRSWKAMLDAGLCHIIMLKRGDDVLGAIGFCVMGDLNCAMRNAHELFWFVLPEHRKGRAAFKLLDAYEKKAIELGASSAVIAHLANLNENLGAFYERRGYIKTEILYRKPL